MLLTEEFQRPQVNPAYDNFANSLGFPRARVKPDETVVIAGLSSIIDFVANYPRRIRAVTGQPTQHREHASSEFALLPTSFPLRDIQVPGLGLPTPWEIDSSGS